MNHNNNRYQDDHDHDVVMPGFRFHPTEEELVEFYLRRKVEGKHFNEELISFLDLYRFDPWELPAMATMGEKEWFFYVPRDRKYRNGDRPNRVTISGYWKATGADRTVRTENLKSIGLKKTLVFYFGKAPRGIRTSWIMNEYRLPQHESEIRHQKLSLCRVYKRVGVEDHPSLSRLFLSNPSTSRGQARAEMTQVQHSACFEEKPARMESDTDGSCSSVVTTVLGLVTKNASSVYRRISATSSSLGSHAPFQIREDEVDDGGLKNHSSQISSILRNETAVFAGADVYPDGDLHLLVNLHQASSSRQKQLMYSELPEEQPPVAFNVASPGPFPASFPEILLDWNRLTDAFNRE